MKFANEYKVVERIQRELNSTRYACTALEALSRGSSNYMFRGVLATPLDDGTTEVVVKHTEGYSAAYPELPMAPSRCFVEKESLEALSTLPPTLGPCTVRTPKLLHFNPEGHTQVLEYLPASVDLKNYVLKHFSATRDAARRTPCRELGSSIGTWLRSFHEWVTLREQHVIRDIAVNNKAMQKQMYELYFERLVDTIINYPTILEKARHIFEDVRDDEAQRLRDPDHLQVIHGDLWTGNAILLDAPLRRGAQVFIIDWEFCQLGSPAKDLGLMVAELYQLYFYKGIEDAKWLIEGLVRGYGNIDDELAFRTAIHIGAHLISFGSNTKEWGTERQIEESVRIGMDLIVHAWHEDRGWFEAGDMACLFVGRDHHHSAAG
ncbi:Protein kinase-like domain containing protein [Naviculisporaceae sp. PSN 640]